MRYERNSGRLASFILIAVMAALFCVGLTGTAQATYRFGNTDGDAATNGTANLNGGWLATSPTRSYMKVVGVGFRGGTNGTIRVGIYSDNTTTGSLLADFGEVTYSGNGSYQDISTAGTYNLASNTQYCLAIKMGSAIGYYGGTATGTSGGIRSFGTTGSANAFGDPLGTTQTSSRYYEYYLVYTVVPNIGSMNDTTLSDAQTGVTVTGGGFENQNEFGAGTSHIYLAPGSTWASHGTLVEQTVTNWPADNSGTNNTLTFTVVQGGLSGTAYVYVVNSDGEANVNGYSVTLGGNYATTTGALTSTGATDTSITAQAAYTGDDAGGNGQNSLSPGNQIEYQNGAWYGQAATVNRTNKTWTATVNGLLPGTSYNFRATFVDSDGVSGTNPATASLTTTYTGIGVGTVTTGAITDNSVVVNAPVDAASDTNTNATVQYQYNNGGGWTNFGTAVSAKSNTSMNITGLTPGTSYDFRVTWTDANGVYNQSTKASLGSPYSSNTANASTTAIGTTVGSLTRTGSTGDTVTLKAAYTGDTDTDNSVTIEYRTPPGSGGWTACGCTPTRVAGGWSATISGLTPLTQYEYRATFTDTDGITGTNPATLIDTTPSGCDAVVNDCMDCHAMPPNVDDHTVGAHQGDSTRYACAVCHFDYAAMANVTSTTDWTTSHSNGKLDIYTSANINGGISGGYYAGYRNGSSLFESTAAANSNNECLNTYCHGTTSPIWGTGTATCGSCHLIGPAGGKHGAHSQGYVGLGNNSNASSYDYGCYKCHPAAMHAQGPADGFQSAYVGFDNATAPVNPSGTYTKGASNYTDAGFSWTNGTCGSTYCHSNGAGGSVASPNWNNGTTTCTSCHGGKTSLTTNSHGQHLNQGFLGRYGCVDCHSATVSGNTTVNNKANHVNGTPDVSMAAGSMNGSKICSNTNCHNTGQATPTDKPSPAWGGTLTCDGCHGTEGTTLAEGAPEYANFSSASRNTFNGHQVPGHVSATSDCNKCHSTTVTTGFAIISTTHLNGTREVVFALGGTYSNKRCSSTDSSCHGAVTPRWGGSLACQDCHLTTGADVNDYVYGGASAQAKLNQNEWQNSGHGRPTGSGAYPLTGNPAANKTCLDCHSSAVAHNTSTNPFRLQNADTSALCLGCHNGTTAVAADNHDLAHVGQGTWTFTPKCVDCHDPHGDSGGVTTAQYNRAMIHASVFINGSNTYGQPNGSFHTMDYPLDFDAVYEWSDFVNVGYNGICQVCHTDAGVTRFRYNAVYDTTHYNTQPCTDCHSHMGGFAPAGACVDCHNTGGAGTTAGKRDAQIDFGMNSHHINAAWGSITERTCSACHVEGNYSDGSIVSTKHKDGVVQLKQWTGAFPTGASNGTFNEITYSASNTASANLACLSCHNETNKAAQPFTTAGDTGTPNSYAWDTNSIDRRWSDTGTTFFSKYDPNIYNVVPQIYKAYSPHGNTAANKRGVQNSATIEWSDDAGGNPSIGCLDCHNSHGSNALNGKTAVQAGVTYTSSVGRGAILKTTATYTPTNGSGTAGAAQPITWSATADLCWDCHLGDDANAPKDYNTGGPTYTAPIAGYYDGTGRWTNVDADDWTGTYQYKVSLTDNGKGDGTQKGGHFGKSSNLTTTPSNSINGTCNVCHDPHGVYSVKTNAAYMVPALKGTWMTSPYKEDRAPDNSGSSFTEAATDNYYGSIWTSRKAFRPVRMNPRFDYNNPPAVGAGYGKGVTTDSANVVNTGQFGIGSTGYYGYFIDDNTFGTDRTNANTGTMVDINVRHGWYNNGTAQTITAQTMTETTAQFEGLCNNCHTAAALQGVNTNIGNGTGTVYVHKTVKGWGASYDDIFRKNDAANHMMGWTNNRTNTGSTMTCTKNNSNGAAAFQLPAGYRWSVNPGTTVDTSNTTPASTATLSGTGGTQNAALNNFHNFPCSKCHTAHTSKLPRLMKTNCIDVGSSTNKPKHADALGSTGEGNYTYPSCNTGGTPDVSTSRLYTMTCHNTRRSNTTAGTAPNLGGGWNVITGW